MIICPETLDFTAFFAFARGMLSRLIGVTGYFLGVVILVVAVILILIALLS